MRNPDVDKRGPGEKLLIILLWLMQIAGPEHQALDFAAVMQMGRNRVVEGTGFLYEKSDEVQIFGRRLCRMRCLRASTFGLYFGHD
jgi:hypothetical protein